jgi:acetyl/propionyl-CoA carboxylase alpha subunit
MIAKLIAHGPTREAALAMLADACDAVEVWPVKTNAGFLSRCLEDPDFIAGGVDTGFIAARAGALAARPEPSKAALAAAAEAVLASADEPAGDPASPWRALTGFRLNAPPHSAVRLFLDGAPVMADLGPERGPERSVLVTEAGEVVVFEAGEAFVFSAEAPAGLLGEAAGDGSVRAPMPGKVAAVIVAVGDAVVRGQALATLEAMKMEHALAAPFDGEVEAVPAKVGDQVSEGAVLVRLRARD